MLSEIKSETVVIPLVSPGVVLLWMRVPVKARTLFSLFLSVGTSKARLFLFERK